MGPMGSQITSLMIVYLTVYSGAGQKNYRSSASLPFVRVIKIYKKIMGFVSDFVLIFYVRDLLNLNLRSDNIISWIHMRTAKYDA